MTRQEAQNLLAGYATGSLSGAERRALFEAALQDQDLFEELAGEHMLKEILDQPGARERLIAALEPSPSRSVWWMRRWPWAAAATILAIAIGVIVMSHTRQLQQESQQIAQVLKTPETLVPQAATPVPAPAPAPRKREKPPPPPPVAPAPLADALEKAGTASSRPYAAAPRAQNEAVSVTAAFLTCFSYDVRADGSLQITVVEPGFLTVTASFAFPKKEADILPTTAFERSMSVRLQVPSDATGIVIAFSKTPGANDAPIEQAPASGLGISRDSKRSQLRIQPTPLFLKLDPR